MKKHLKKIVFGIFLLIFFFFFFSFKLYKFFAIENINTVKEFFRHFYVMGPVLIILFFICFNLAVLPTFYFIIISGFLYGPFFGFLLGWIGMTIGLFVSFINSRYIFREDFLKKFGEKKLFKRLDKLTRKYRGWIVILFRLFFIIPYNFQNVTYGLTSIKAWEYTLCSFIGILPISFVYALLGHLLSINKIGPAEIKNISIILAILVISLAITISISVLLRKRLKFNEE